VLACDLHSGQSMGYFDIVVDHVPGQVYEHILVTVSRFELKKKIEQFLWSMYYCRISVVSPTYLHD
jgi:phosphoribosylpyrophosphate synthetase